jgi:hypothetical protein
MSIFQKKLEDVVRGARAPGIDPGVWNPHIMKELKEELKSKEPEAKAIALTKLFYVTCPLTLYIIVPSRWKQHRLGQLQHSRLYEQSECQREENRTYVRLVDHLLQSGRNDHVYKLLQEGSSIVFYNSPGNKKQ